METPDAEQQADATEVIRRINAMQTAMLDSTFPREMREGEVTGMWNDFGPLALLGAGQIAANRATLALRAAESFGGTSLPMKELRKMVPSTVPAPVREAAIDIVVLMRRPVLNWDEMDRRRDVIIDSPQPIDGFVALLALAHGLGTLLVEFSSEYDSVADVVRGEALQNEQPLD